MDFDKQKQKYLAELESGLRDKSKKGFIDAEIKELVTVINKHPSYYTTSSCSGRILLYSISPDRKKNETEWILVSHQEVLLSEISEKLKSVNSISSDIVFFRFEPLILHIVCKDLDAAQQLLLLCNTAGLKHSGAISLGERIVVEIVGNDRLDAPVAKAGTLLITSEGISHFVADANEKMKRNVERIERLRNEMDKNK
ncbi:hypothetical protein HZC31_01450 [Candidatus Woesearchaeota archaeon]|nr:hypothetical protein [Candidatus Woesearchaeota archaeon]